MGVHTLHPGPVGRPFTIGNRGGGRPKGVPNKATQEIKAFGRSFLMSDSYRRSLMRRIEAGKAPHMEALLHHYTFGLPKYAYVQPPPEQSPLETVMRRMTKEELREMSALARRMHEIQQQALARLATSVPTGSPGPPP